MRLRLCAVCILMLCASWCASGHSRELAASDCSDLDRCMAWLGTRASLESDGGHGTLCDVASRELAPFGNEAKRRLWDKLTSKRKGWADLASCVLRTFPALSEEDVPRLRELLRGRYDGWEATALSRIGSDSAIRALIEALPQTGFALTKLGARSLPYLLDFMTEQSAAQSGNWIVAQQIITDMGTAAVVVAESWRDVATNPAEPETRRIAALRGLEAMGDKAGAIAPAIAALLHEERPAIRAAAQATLLAMRDPSALSKLVAECQPANSVADRQARPDCLIDIARFGPAAEPYGPQILKFLRSGAEYDAIYGAVTLGMIGYRSAAPDLTRALESSDWRMTLASARSLGWLKASEAETSLSNVARRHWLRVVRSEAERALRSVRGEQTSTPAYDWGSLFDAPFDFESVPFKNEAKAECPSDRWAWSGGEIYAPRENSADAELRALGERHGLDSVKAFLRVEDGLLLGTNAGEFGGALWFQSAEGARVKLYDLNITNIGEGANGIIALAGMTHLFVNFGEVLSIKSSASGGYSARHQIALPGAPSYMASVGGGDFLIATYYGAYILHGGWRMEEARCTAGR